MRRASWLQGLLVVTGVAVGTVPLAAQTRDPALTKVIDDWTSRRRIATTVEYKVEGTTTAMAHKFGDVPKDDFTAEKKVTWLLCFEKNWVRQETYEYQFFGPLRAFAPHYSMALFDGEKARIYEPREKNTSPVYTPSAKQPDLWFPENGYYSVMFSYVDQPIFLAHGIVENSKLTCRPDRLLIPMDPSEYVLHGRGNVDDVPCLIVRTRPNRSGNLTEYWVDPARSSAVLRCIYTGQGKPVAQVECAYKETKWGWLPAHWKCIFYDADKVCDVNDLKVTAIAVNPPVARADFQVPFEPGQVVMKVGQGKNDVYRVRDDGSLEDYEHDLPPSRWMNLWTTGMVVTIAVAVGLASFVVFRRRKKTKTA